MQGSTMTEVFDMSDDHILLITILDDHEINVKQLAADTGYGASTLYRFLAGGATIPSVIWRSLFNRTGDARICRLMTGDVPVMTVRLLNSDKKLDGVTLKNLIETRQKQIEFEKRVLNIIADGKIDGLDRKDIAELKRVFPDMISNLAQIYHAITGDYEKA